MKNKLTVFLAGLFLLLGTAGSANAVPWTWDFTGTGFTPDGLQVDGMKVTFNDFMGAGTTLDEHTIVNQDLGGDGILNNDDEFTDLGFLNVLDTDGFPLLIDGGSSFVYIAFSGLTGIVKNYNNGGDGDTTIDNYDTRLANDSYELDFKPGVGTMAIYLDDDMDPTNAGTTELGTFSLLAGVGTSPEFIIGEAEGQFGLVGGFQTVRDDFWHFADGTDFDDWLTTYGPNSIILNTFNLGATFKGVSDDDDNSLIFEIANKGNIQIDAIPEPTTMLLFGVGLLGLAGVSRKKKIA